MRILLLAVLAAATLLAQPKAVDVFGEVGRFRLGGDEGSLGSATSYGASIMAPLIGKWAVDVSVLTGHTESERPAPDYFRIGRTLLMPSLVRRWGAGRVYAFAGAGIGGVFDRTSFSYQACQTGQPCQFINGRDSENDRNLHGKLGFVANPVGRLLIRADVYSSFRYVLPDAGIKVGIGIRIQ